MGEFKHPWLVSVWGTVTGIAIFILSFFVILSLSPRCWAGGILSMVFSIVLLVLEAPFLAKSNEKAQKLAEIASKLAHWQKGVLYFVMSFAPFLCISISGILAGLLYLTNGMGYFVLAIGPKGNSADGHELLGDENA